MFVLSHAAEAAPSHLLQKEAPFIPDALARGSLARAGREVGVLDPHPIYPNTSMLKLITKYTTIC